MYFDLNKMNLLMRSQENKARVKKLKRQYFLEDFLYGSD